MSNNNQQPTKPNTPAIRHSMGGELPESKSHPVSSELAMPEKGRLLGGDLPANVHRTEVVA